MTPEERASLILGRLTGEGGVDLPDETAACLVADIQDELRAAIYEEREACAKVAISVCANDPEAVDHEIGHPPCCHALQIAVAIRART